jgi:hypothetical protein
MEVTEAIVVATPPPPEPPKAVEELPLPVAGNLLVVARNSAEMAQAQMKLVSWAIGKVALEKSKLEEAEALLAKAKSMHQRTSSLAKAVATAKGSVLYYAKVQQAIEAGYCIVPNFPIELIMVRTDAEEPVDHEVNGSWASLPAVRPAQLPTGMGRYVSAEVASAVREDTTEKDGKVTKTKVRYTTGFQDVAFPARLAKIAILSDLDVAQKRKIFDSIGVLPATRRQPDPMLIGQIHCRQGRRDVKTISFMIAWWIDTSML